MEDKLSTDRTGVGGEWGRFRCNVSDGAANEALLLCPPLTSCCVPMDQHQTAVQRLGIPGLESLKLLRRTVGIFFIIEMQGFCL